MQRIQQGLEDHLSCIARLMACRLMGRDLIARYFKRRVASLMAGPLRLHEMSVAANAEAMQA